ncbi:hypothetical protein AB4391_19290 [Vibrio lentus]
MSLRKCAFCSRSDVALSLLGSGRACCDCIATANQLINVERLSPNNQVEEAALSLIFFLETDLVLTRQLLSGQSMNEGLQKLIRQKRDKLASVVADYNEIGEHYSKKIKALIKEHSVLLDLYTNAT